MGSVRVRCVLVALGFAIRGSAQSQGVSIEHKPVACVVADRFPLVEARVEPAAKVARARVLFRAAGTPDWYFVEMKPEKGVFHGTLPKPLKATKQIEYYIDAMDQGMEERRTAEYAPAVVGGAGECPSKMLTAAVLTSAKLAIGSLTPGVTALPAGFSSIGIVGGSVAGTAAGAGASSGAAAGGGALKTVLIVAGAAAVGGGALVATGTLNVENKMRQFEMTWMVSPPEPGDFSGGFSDLVCDPNIPLAQSRSFGGRGASSLYRTDDNGNFDANPGPSGSPPFLRLSGRVTETSFSATLTCLVGSGTTSLNATGSGGDFQGASSLNGRTVAYTVSYHP